MNIHQSYNILFWLNKTRKRNGKCAIYLRLTIDSKRIELSTYQYAAQSEWNKSLQRIKPTSVNADSVNRIIDIIQSNIHRHYSVLAASHEFVSAEMVKNAYLGIKEKQHTVVEAFDFQLTYFSEKAKAGIISVKHVNRLAITKNKVVTFMKERYDVADKPLLQLKLSFANELYHYLTVTDKIGSNTAMKYIKNTKQVFKMAVDNDWIPTNPISSFKCSYNEPNRERLTMSEIMTLYNKEFEIKRLEEVRDVYIFCCFTGFAFYDVSKLTQENIELGIDGEKWVFKERQKTKTVERIPLLPTALEIISKYSCDPYCLQNNCLLPVCSNARFNGYLKEVAHIAGISKYLTSHTARHTFATTVTLENDMPIETVSQLLGHKSIRTTQIYAKITHTKLSNNMKALREKLDTMTKQTEINNANNI